MAMAGRAMDATKGDGTSAAMLMKSTPMPMDATVLKKGSTGSSETFIRLASLMAPAPMRSAVSRPLSSERKLAKPAAKSTVPTRTWVPRTLLPRVIRVPRTARTTPTAARMKATTKLHSRARMASSVPSVLATRTTWKVTTARIPPRGSSMVPSHTRMPRTRALGLAKLRIGVTTVGPDTMRMAPSRNANGHDKPSRKCAASDPAIQVMGAPIQMSRRTTDLSAPCRLISPS